MEDVKPWRIVFLRSGFPHYSCNCHNSKFRKRVVKFLHTHPELAAARLNIKTEPITTDYGHLLTKVPQKRPLWGRPQTQWEIDEAGGKRRLLTSVPPKTPLPTFFKPLPDSANITCSEDVTELLYKRPPILVCARQPCRRITRAIHRHYMGKHPKESEAVLEPPPEEEEEEEPLIKRLMTEMQKIFNDFLSIKVPIVLIYGRPIKSIANIRRKYALSLAETYQFTYLSLDDEIALLAAKGSHAIEEGNILFEGFEAVERLALPICIKLIKEDDFSLTRGETIDMLKFLMLQYYPTRGYVIDGFPLDGTDNVNFESTFYPPACGLYFLDEQWTTNKSVSPAVIHPLYFRRMFNYTERNAEDACGKLGLRTLKIIGTETLFDDPDKLEALHEVVKEYLDVYDEILEGNDEILRDDTLEYQTFGQTLGYGVDLEDFMKKKKEQGESRKSEAGKGESRKSDAVGNVENVKGEATETEDSRNSEVVGMGEIRKSEVAGKGESRKSEVAGKGESRKSEAVGMGESRKSEVAGKGESRNSEAVGMGESRKGEAVGMGVSRKGEVIEKWEFRKSEDGGKEESRKSDGGGKEAGRKGGEGGIKEESRKSDGGVKEESRKSDGGVKEESRKSDGGGKEESRKSDGGVKDGIRKSDGGAKEESRKSDGGGKEESRKSDVGGKDESRKSDGGVKEEIRKGDGAEEREDGNREMNVEGEKNEEQN